MNDRHRPFRARAFGALTRGLIVGSFVASGVGCPGGLDDPSQFFGDEAGVTGGPDAGVPVPGAEASTGCVDVPSGILAARCAGPGCHGAASPAAALDLVSSGLAARVVGRPASGGGLLVDPANPQASVLYTKLLPSPPFGSRMPLGMAPLDASNTACVLSWITALGAPGGDASSPPQVDASVRDAPAPDAWIPTNLPATVIWLDAHQGVKTTAGVVSGWADRSSFANDAAQSDGATAPTVDATGFQGGPAIRFDAAKGTFLSIADASSLQWGTGGFLVAIVGASTKATAGLGHGGGVSTVFAKPQLQSAVEITVHWNYFTAENTDDDSTFNAQEGEGEPGLVSTTNGYNDGSPRLYVARVDTSSGKASMELRVNGVTVGSSTGSPLVDVSLPGSPVRIGSTYGQSVQGEIAEVVAVRGTVTAGDLAHLEGYLMTKYGLNAAGDL